jgi:hypothetical protein
MMADQIERYMREVGRRAGDALHQQLTESGVL